MVQRKVSNKLGIQANNIISLKTEKKQPCTKPSLLNHDGKSKVADLKAIKMKKSRTIKRSDFGFSSLSSPNIDEAPQQPGEPPPMVTPSPKKPSYNKSSYASPNYMKSTSSSKARKEYSPKVSISSTSQLHHKVGKTLGKTSSSLKKVRTLTKVPSFKHTRTLCNKNKVVLCEDINVQKATCSSTLKDSKFPRYLTLVPGATEAEGTSIMKVCPYNYCSLNGHHHTPAPPLKRFLSSRRMMLKTKKDVKPEVSSPTRKRKPSETKVKKDGETEVHDVISGMSVTPRIESEDFFVEIYVPGREVPASNDAAKVSESLSEGPNSNMDNQDYADKKEADDLLEVNFSSKNTEEEDFLVTPFRKSYESGSDLEVQSSSAVSLDQYFGENSDLEWEEGNILGFQEEEEGALTQKDDGDDQEYHGFEFEEFLAGKLTPYIYDEIMERLQFSDADSEPDSESTQSDQEYIDETDSEKEQDNAYNGEEEATVVGECISVDGEAINGVELKDEFVDGQRHSFSDSDDEVSEARNEDSDSSKVLNDDEWHGDNLTNEEVREGNDGDIVMEENKSSETAIKDIQLMSENLDDNGANEEVPVAGYASQEEVDQSGVANEAEHEENDVNRYVPASSTNLEEETGFEKVQLHPIPDHVVEVELPEMTDTKQIKEEEASPAIKNSSREVKKCIHMTADESENQLLDICSNLKRSVRNKRENEDDDEAREFNPRGPNFLPVVPDPDAEKVDLRHQEMDERRNAEEWMLDYALQKTVNRLAPARKRKVALLVKAFESVLPIPKNEPQMRKNSSGFSSDRPIQACS